MTAIKLFLAALLLTACAHRQPMGEDLWIGVRQMEHISR